MKAVINTTRCGMGLEDFSPAWWLSQFNRLRVPCTYLWSPLLLPKPADWASNISVAGFAFEDEPEDFVPPADLVKFLEKGPQPPVLYSYGQMLGFLVAALWKELQSIAYQPAELKKGGRGIGRVVLEVPLAILRVLVALVNIIVGFVGISLRMADLACSKALGERDDRDVVAEARLRQGRIEAEELAIERTEEGGHLTAEVLRAWDAES
ncbi:Sterol 3-beta-glucosyltransferase UGT80A2 [Colletotrichum sp. SAR 10_98]|nr:Sterol 3-beta-glucosyltransferase UGT80A2 [Colletotrichum sp. SAR 10_98]